MTLAIFKTVPIVLCKVDYRESQGIPRSFVEVLDSRVFLQDSFGYQWILGKGFVG